ncbi:hypothetical protein BDV93DRAFT_543533 [Ceratobasidium sp. AG-I]|nr:hypothetical protein BDV93DRAFT_543533 [Ceratobasidium sp. AG-I]
MATSDPNATIPLLHQYLRHLPQDFPPASHRLYPFKPFTYDHERLERTEDLAGTVGHVFKTAFGWGEQVEAAADVLEQYIPQCPGNEGILVKWVEDLLRAAKDVCAEHEIKVPRFNAGGENFRAAQDRRGEQDSKRTREEDQSVDSVVLKKATASTKKQKVESAKAPESDSEDEGQGSPGTCIVKGKRYQLVDVPESNSKRGRPPSEFLKLVSRPRIEEVSMCGSQVSEDVGIMKRTTNPTPLEKLERAVEGVTEAVKEGTKGAVQTMLTNMVGQAGRDKLKVKGDAEFTLLFCETGMPFRLWDLPRWRSSLEAISPAYKPPTASDLADGLIPKQAAHVRMVQLGFLKTQKNITLSFDGGSTRRETFTSVSAIAPGGRTILLKLCEGTGDSHTGNYYKGILSKWVRKIGPARIIAIVSDNAGNACLGRELAVAEFKNIYNLADVCHKLHSLIALLGDSHLTMSAPSSFVTPSPSALRRRTITQGTKIVVKSLNKFIGVPGIQDFVESAQELAVALKAPGVNDTNAEAFVSQIVDTAKMVGDAMGQLETMGDDVATAYLEKLQPFTEYLERTKAEIDHHQRRSYINKIALHSDMAELLRQREAELRYRTLLLCLEKSLLMDQTAAQTHQTIVQIRAQLVNSANCHQATREEVTILKAEIAQLRIMLDSRSNLPHVLRI